MKQKPAPDMDAYVSGIAVGAILMYAFWWMMTGMQHPGAIAGGAVVLVAIGIVGSIARRRSRKRSGR